MFEDSMQNRPCAVTRRGKPRAYLNVQRREACGNEGGQRAAEHLAHHGLRNTEEPDSTASHAEERRRQSVELRRLEGHIRVDVFLR